MSRLADLFMHWLLSTRPYCTCSLQYSACAWHAELHKCHEHNCLGSLYISCTDQCQCFVQWVVVVDQEAQLIFVVDSGTTHNWQFYVDKVRQYMLDEYKDKCGVDAAASLKVCARTAERFACQAHKRADHSSHCLHSTKNVSSKLTFTHHFSG